MKYKQTKHKIRKNWEKSQKNNVEIEQIILDKKNIQKYNIYKQIYFTQSEWKIFNSEWTHFQSEMGLLYQTESPPDFREVGIHREEDLQYPRVQYWNQKSLRISEEMIPYVDYYLLFENAHDYELSFSYVNEPYQQSVWRDFYQVYGNGLLLWQGTGEAVVPYYSPYAVAIEEEIWRCKYPKLYFNVGLDNYYTPCWDGGLTRNIRIYYNSYVNDGYVSLSNIPLDAFDNPIYSTVTFTKNLPDQEHLTAQIPLPPLYRYHQTLAGVGSQNEYWFKKSDNEVILFVEGLVHKSASKRIIPAQIIPGEATFSKVYTIHKDDIGSGTHGHLVSNVTSVTSSHTHWNHDPTDEEHIQLKNSLVVNIINPNLTYKDENYEIS